MISKGVSLSFHYFLEGEFNLIIFSRVHMLDNPGVLFLVNPDGVFVTISGEYISLGTPQ